MADLDRELGFVVSMASDLKEYLLSDTLYWQLSNAGPRSMPYPLGTLGGMLLRLRRLEAASGALSPDQFERYEQVRQEAEDSLKHWAIQAEQKMVREIKARLQTWSAFLDDAIGDPTRHIPEYPTQVENRVIMAMLLTRAGRAAEGQGFRTRLETLDQRLGANTERGDFVWDSIYASAFPADTDWWLYVRLRQ